MTYNPTSNYNPPNRWYNVHVNTEVVNDSNVCFSGDTCLSIINRTVVWHQVLYVASYDLFEPGYTYLFNLFIKLTKSTHDVVKIETLSRSWYKNSSHPNNPKYKFYTRRYDKVEGLWLFLSMDFRVTEQDINDFEYVDFYIQVSDETDYMIDAVSLTKVDYPNWKNDAIKNIANYRMGEISIRMNVSDCLDPSKLAIHVNQTRKHFPFGLAVSAWTLGDNDSDPVVQRYKAFVERHATWAVFLNAAKWKTMEYSRRDDTDEKFQRADNAYSLLTSKNITVRGHTVHWNVLERTPTWVAEESNKTAAINRRTSYVVEHFKGKFPHWDVLNEYSNSRLYQDWLGREDVLEYLHNEVQKIDPNVMKFTNEWGNLQQNIHFADSVNAVLRLKKRNLIDGIGLQGHLSARGDSLDMDVIKRRLEVFTGLGIPVWITELTVAHDDPVRRGQLLADCLTLFYGTPGVHGILLWDFAPWRDYMLDHALASPDLTVNAAGKKFGETLDGWSTNVVLESPDTVTSTLFTPAYYGTYDISVYYDGVKEAEVTNVKLDPEHNTLQLNCDVMTSGSSIVIAP